MHLEDWGEKHRGRSLPLSIWQLYVFLRSTCKPDREIQAGRLELAAAVSRLLVEEMVLHALGHELAPWALTAPAISCVKSNYWMYWMGALQR